MHLPQAIDAAPPQVADAAKAFRADLAAATDAEAALRRARRALEEAQEARRLEVLSAAKHGTPLGEGRAVIEAEANVRTGIELVDMTRRRAHSASARTLAAIAAGAEEWRPLLVADIATSTTELVDALDHLEAALATHLEQLGLLDWLARVERRAADPAASGRLPVIPAPETLLGPHDPTKALSLLRVFATPAPPEEDANAAA